MTEAEWLTCADPAPLLAFLDSKVSDRKWQMFAVACCLRMWDLMLDPRARYAVEILELNADGACTPDEWSVVGGEFLDQSYERAIWYSQLRRPERYAHSAVVACFEEKDLRLAVMVSNAVCSAVEASAAWNDRQQRKAEEKRAQVEIVRDIFGNPFRPVTFNLSWLTSTVVALAEGIYQDRAFDRMPILADALQDAGCYQPDILSHCRGDGLHVRGCWVVDLLLGKS